MDPFSITVGSLTLVGVITASGKAARKLLGLKKAPVEIQQLVNEIDDFKASVTRSQELLDGLRSQGDDKSIVSSLERSYEHATKILEELDRTLRDQILESLNNGSLLPTKLEFSKIAWLKRQGKVRGLQAELRATKMRITETHALISSSAVPEFRSELHSISVQGKENNMLLRSMLQVTKNVLATISQPALTDALVTPSDQSADPQQRLVLDHVPQAVEPKFSEDIEPAASSIAVSAVSWSTTKCKVLFCQCWCHKTTKTQPLSWISGLVGSLLVGYSGVTSPFRGEVKCSEKTCERTEKRLVQVTYHFPSWVPYVSRVISIIGSSNGLDGHSIFVNFPRVVPANAELFILAQKGNITGMQRLFKEKKASIHDVSYTEGRSALHFALTANQPKMAAFLISQKANVNIEDKQSLSPIDILWNYVLETPNDPMNIAFKDAFKDVIDESEDLQKRNFTAIHLAVIGLSAIKLEDYLHSSTSEIDICCSFGRTPLCWAAQFRNDYSKVQILLKHGAAVNLCDKRKQNAFHFAAETGSFEALKLLMKVAVRLERPDDCQMSSREFLSADNVLSDDDDSLRSSSVCRQLIEAKDYKGRSALQFAVRTNQVRHAELLITYGADIDSPDTVLSRVPIMIAIYWNHHNMIRILLKHKVRLDVIDDNSMTILHYAAKFGDCETLQILSGVNRFPIISLNCKDRDQRTPQDVFDHDRQGVLAESDDVTVTSRAHFDKILQHVQASSKLPTNGIAPASEL